jgi:hypothetical protein
LIRNGLENRRQAISEVGTNTSDAAIQTCLTLKVLFGMPLRQTTVRPEPAGGFR